MGKQSKRNRPVKAQAPTDGTQQQQQPTEAKVTNFPLSKAGRSIHEIWVQKACQGEDMCNREMGLMIAKKVEEDGLGRDVHKNQFTEATRMKKLCYEYQEKLKHEISREFAIMHRDILLDMAAGIQKSLDENPIEKIKADEARQVEADIAAEIQRQASLQPTASASALESTDAVTVENVASAEPPVVVEDVEYSDDDDEEEEEKPDCNCLARSMAYPTNPRYSCYKCETVASPGTASVLSTLTETPIGEVESTCAVQPGDALSVVEQLARCSVAMNEAIDDMARATSLSD